MCFVYYQGLLRFAMEATKSEDAPENPNYSFARMDPERRQFLENALKALTIDVIEELQKAAATIGSSTATEGELLQALETITEYIIDIDTAIDFCKIGGLSVLLPCLKSPYVKVRAKAASVIAELAQNNPYCQKELMTANALPDLMELVSEPETAPNGLIAISGLVRSYEPILTAFLEIGGLECLIGCLQSGQEKVIVRSLFLFSSLCTDFPAVRDEFVKLKAIERIIPLLRPSNDYDLRTETALWALNILTDNADAVSQCQTSDLNLKEIIDEIIKTAGNKSACRETVEYAQSILQKVFIDKQEPTDR